MPSGMVGQFTPALVADGNIAPFRLVMIPATGVDNTGSQSGDASAQAIGIADGSNRDYTSAYHAIAGDSIKLQPGKVMRLECDGDTGSAIDAGDPLASDASGMGVPAAAGEFSPCRALEDTAAAAQVIRVLWEPFYVPV